MPNIEDFSYEELGTTRYAMQKRRQLFQEIAQNPLPAVFVAGDSLSIEPQVGGVYEPIIKNLIDHAAQSGYHDFLIDIGANIGLSSCQSGMAFTEIHGFEPNPICATICQLNLQKFLPPDKYQLHPYGLGESDRIATLKIPYRNMGGAFISDGVNSYSHKVLAEKDNFQSFDANNYFEQAIEIRSAKDVLQGLLQQLLEKKLRSGIIIIDVEGYEPIILEALSIMPNELRCIIIFESWDHHFDVQKILDAFGSRAVGFSIQSQRSYKSLTHRLLKKLFASHAADLTYHLVPYKKGDRGDLVIQVDSTHS
jgi:FkbM family methyltransferase